jgi:chromosome segregation protein
VRAVAAAASAVAEVETLRTQAQTALPDLRSEEARAAAVLRHVELKREQLKQETAQAEARASELEARITQMEQDRAREAAAIADTAETLERLASERAGLITEVDGADATGQALVGAETDAQTALATEEEALSALTRQLAEADAARQQLARRVDEQTRQLAGLEQSLETVRRETKLCNRMPGMRLGLAGSCAGRVGSG